MTVCPECNQEHTPFCAPRSHDFSRSGGWGWMIGLALLLILLGSLGWMLNEEREAHQETMATMHAQSSMIAQINASHITATANAEQAVLQKTATVQAATTLEAEQTATVQVATTLEAEQTATTQAATTLEAEQTATAQPATTLEAEQMPTALQTAQQWATAEATLQIANQTAPVPPTQLAENSQSATTTSGAVSTTLAAQTASGLTENVTKVANSATSMTESATAPALATEWPSIASSTPLTPSATPPALASELPSIASSTPLTPSATPPALATELPSITASTPLTSSESAINSEAESPLVERMTESAQNAPEGSPYYKTTWVTYYGRPNIGVMGILGAYNINELIPLLREQTLAYDEANGPELDVMPAFHLVYGMATILPGEDNDHLAFLSDEVVMAYIEAAQQENMAVILDIQIGALPPPEAIERGLPFLQYENVHLAIDPEFAMKEPNQSRPGNPIGFITAQEVNQVQQTMQEHINNHQIPGTRILLLHQFLDTMILNKEQLQPYRQINLTITADGWGPPKGKIRKYNELTNQNTFFTGFKLFYDWDHPLLTEREALGIDPAEESSIQITPNLIIYQ
ncbi:MAG: hypothetical protein ACPGWR_02525 [Ardenticatenaceae bacterium]